MERNSKRLLSLMLAMLLLSTIMLTGCRKTSGERNDTKQQLEEAFGNLRGGGGNETPAETEKDSATSDRNGKKDNDAEKPDTGKASISYGNRKGKEMNSKEIAEYCSTRVVMVKTDLGHGSGFFIDDQGTLVTNYHVIDGASSINIQFDDGGIYPVNTIVDFESKNDIAVLKALLSGNDYFQFADEHIKGEQVYVSGYPKNAQTSSLTQGGLSMTSYQVGLIDCITIDAAISSGNSGGPAVNTKGEVLGICSFSRGDAQNMNFAIKPYVLNELSMSRNYNIAQYRDWYSRETGKSYMSTSDGKHFSNTLVYTYTAVTGEECLYSTDHDDNVKDEKGYSVGYLYYYYSYDLDSYEDYRDYLTSIGFIYNDTEKDMGTEIVSYYDPLNGYYMQMLVDTVDNYIIVSTPTL